MNAKESAFIEYEPYACVEKASMRSFRYDTLNKAKRALSKFIEKHPECEWFGIIKIENNEISDMMRYEERVV